MFSRCLFLFPFASIISQVENHDIARSWRHLLGIDVRGSREQLETLSELFLAIQRTYSDVSKALNFGHRLSLTSHRESRHKNDRASITTAIATRAEPGRAAIVGAGPAGLLSAIMLSRRGWSVSVYDSRQAPPPPDDPQWGAGERSYQLGLNGRGQKALREFDAFECVSKYAASVNGRLTFDKEGKPVEQRLKPPGTPGAEKSYVTRVLQRDRLQSCLLEEIANRYPEVSVNWGIACDGVDVSGDKPVLRLCASEGESCDIFADISLGSPVDLVVGADGVRSVVRESLETAPGSNTRTVRFDDRNERVYRTLPLHPAAVAGTPTDLNWGTRNETRDLGMDALPTKEGEMVAVILFKPDSLVGKEIDALSTASEARKFFSESLPSIIPYCTDEELERFVRRPTSRLPSFQLVEGDVSKILPHGSVALLGDSIKAVKPYFGQGANSALEDVSKLAECLQATSDDPVSAAVKYSQVRAEDARALVRTSRSFDMPGKLGLARFLVPIILDTQLNKVLPAIFSPPMLRALQDERNTFVGLRWKKRRERVMLLGMLTAALSIPKVFR